MSRIEGLGLMTNQEAWGQVLVEEALKTSEIEGEKLSPQSVRSSVARRLGLPTAGLPAPDRRADGLVEVLLDATLHHEKPLTIERLKGWQAALFPTGYSGLHPIVVGEWRGPEAMRVVSGPVGREVVHFEAPPAERVEGEMLAFIDWWKESCGHMEGFIRAGVTHFRFVTIHPFEDGNGCVARALTDMALAQDEHLDRRFYSLSSQIMAERKQYYDILEQTQRGDGDISEWLLWFLSALERAIEGSEGVIAKVIETSLFWQAHAQKAMNERQRKIVGRMVAAGRGGFEGGLTTRKYVSMSGASRATAYREISELVNMGIVQRRAGKGRSASYDLQWPAKDEKA